MNYDDNEFHDHHHNTGYRRNHQQYDDPYQESAHRHNQYYSSNAYYYDNGGPSFSTPPLANLLASLRSWLWQTYRTNPNATVGGIGIAVIVVLVVHYRESVKRIVNGNEYQRRTAFRDLPTTPSLLDHFYQSLSSCTEAVNRFKILLLSSSGIESHSGNNHRDDRKRHSNDGRDLSGLGAALESRFGGNGKGHLSSSSILPQLEEVDSPSSPPSSPAPESFRSCGGGDDDDGGRSCERRYCEGEIEPAFLSVNEYPEGWLVYDPDFGIVTKEVSDKWRGAENGGIVAGERGEEKKEGMTKMSHRGNVGTADGSERFEGVLSTGVTPG